MRLGEIIFIVLSFPLKRVLSYWDVGTTTYKYSWRTDYTPRQSRFRWQRSERDIFRLFFPWWDWYELEFRRRLYCVCGISYDFININTGAILNRRTVLTSANALEEYQSDAQNLRIWALGRQGEHITPYRYRVWRLTRLFPRSKNPEHQHGPWGFHSPRHDVSLIHTLDQMFVYHVLSTRFHYAYRAFIPPRGQQSLTDLDYMVGSGFEYLEHVRENYKIFYSMLYKRDVVNCEFVLPKFWGKFVCFRNILNFPGVQNGGPFFDYHILVGVGCFEIRYHEFRVLVFTDLRYYYAQIYTWCHLRPGDYYEYAYPHYSIKLELLGLWESMKNTPTIPTKNQRDDLYPLG